MLNQNQTKAVVANDRFIFLLAGAGTGKTRVLIERIKRLIKEGVSEGNLLVITFTKKSAEELKERIPKKLGNPLITTFHGFCYQMLKPHIKIRLVDNDFLIQNGFTKDDIRNIDIQKRNQHTSKLLKRYNKLLKKHQYIDFTDLEIIMLQKLKDKSFKKQITDTYTHLFIDEFQDTSFYQFALIKQFKSNHSYIFSVGDPDQSIYGFRGANKQVIEQYLKYFKAKLYTLDLNYRSSKEIVLISNRVIKHNTNRYPKTLVSFIKEKGHIHIRYFKDETDQINYIINEIKTLLAKRLQYQDIAILYRNHYLSNNLKQAFIDRYIEGINLLTIHQSKGLEFKAVFIIGLNEGILPMDDIEEERRLFYVAMTRAKRHLYLLVNTQHKVSRFIGECL